MERRDRCGNKGSRLVVKKAKRDRERQAKQQRAVEARTRKGCGGQKREDVCLGSRKKRWPRRSQDRCEDIGCTRETHEQEDVKAQQRYRGRFSTLPARMVVQGVP